MSAEMITGRTRGGEEWTPSFINDLNQQTCIGCGRCYKVCPRDVFELVDRAEALAEDEDDYDDDDETKVMAIANSDDCIGCQSCFRVCPKQCHSHAPAAA